VIKKKNFPEEEQKIWEEYTRSPTDIYDKERENITNVQKKKRFKFDLHGFTLDEANNKVKEIIISCAEKKYNEILLITGKGLHSTTDRDIYVSKDLSKLKFSVPEYINSIIELSDCVLSISEASIEDGGSGAILIKLKNFIK